MASATDVAAQYGYSVAFFNSDPELKGLLNQAVTGNWTPAQFVAKLQATKWFKTNGEAARQIFALKTSDPATYNQRLQSAIQQVRDQAWQLGATSTIKPADLKRFAENALAFGWSESQIKQALLPFVKPVAGQGTFQGAAADVQSKVNDLLVAYGKAPTGKDVNYWVGRIIAGGDPGELKLALIQEASSRYPGLRERLQGGETLEDIAAPYRDSYSRILEIPAESVSVQDALIQKAFGAKDAKGKPTTKTIWQFEQELRDDPRWLKTKNAQDELVGNTRKVLQDFGLVV